MPVKRYVSIKVYETMFPPEATSNQETPAAAAAPVAVSNNSSNEDKASLPDRTGATSTSLIDLCSSSSDEENNDAENRPNRPQPKSSFPGSSGSTDNRLLLSRRNVQNRLSSAVKLCEAGNPPLCPTTIDRPNIKSKNPSKPVSSNFRPDHFFNLSSEPSPERRQSSCATACCRANESKCRTGDDLSSVSTSISKREDGKNAPTTTGFTSLSSPPPSAVAATIALTTTFTTPSKSESLWQKTETCLGSGTARTVAEDGTAQNTTIDAGDQTTFGDIDVKLLSEKSKECWVCGCELEKPQGEFCWYTKHQHPLLVNDDEDEEGANNFGLLAACVCSVCAEEVVANENQETSEDCSDICCLCLKTEEDVDMFFACDDCPRQVCVTCVAACHGGGDAGKKKAFELSISEEPWSCPVCEPPAVLRQGHVEPHKDRSVEQALDDLACVEAELARANIERENEERKREEIIAELRGSGKFFSEEDVDEEMELLQLEQAKHVDRLMDTIASLQEELEQVHGEDLANVYANGLGIQPALASTEEEQEWALRAAKFNKEREEQEQMKRESQPMKARKVPKEDEAFKFIEDLMVEEDADKFVRIKPKAKGFSLRHLMPEADSDDERDALEAEDREIKERHIKPIKIRECDDEKVQKEEEIYRFKTLRAKATKNRNRSMSSSAHVAAGRKSHPPPTSKQEQPQKPTASTRASGDSHLKEPPNGVAATSPEKIKPAASTPSPSIKFHSSPSCDMATKGAETKKRAALEQLRPRSLGTKTSLLASSQEQRSATVTRRARDLFRKSALIYQDSQVCVARNLVDKLKPHQKQAVQFMWKNCFADHIKHDEAAASLPSSKPGGCILAHHMGLGKSFALIAFIQSVMLHELGIKKVLLTVPVNTLENWKNEFRKWIGEMRPRIDVIDLADTSMSTNIQRALVKRWHDGKDEQSDSPGSVLLVSHSRLSNLLVPVKKKNTCAAPRTNQSADPTTEYLQDCDLFCVDEAHLVLKSSETKRMGAFRTIKTERRICLTGTPLQNNMQEYHTIVEYVRPGLLEDLNSFDREFIQPIQKGLEKDCSPAVREESLKLTHRLHKILDPFVHRREAKELTSSLPPMQQVVLHIRQTRMQSNIYKSYKRHQGEVDSKNFFKEVAALKPIHNHPGCLLYRDQQEVKKKKGEECSEDDEDEAAVSWWDSITKKFGKTLEGVDQGYKMILLLHILVLADQRNEKVAVFSSCIKSLNYVQHLLETPRWVDKVPSLSELLGDSPDFGGFKKDSEFVRIDGRTNAADRGGSIVQFDRDDNVRVFLLSSMAGGVGINLVAANRVVLLDSHFNPAVSEQAVFRAYRYGQQKPVFVYRFLTQGSIEQKIYARIVAKTGLAYQVVDKKSITRHFTGQQLADLCQNLEWAQCDRCHKWRVLLGGESQNDLPEKWYCEMNADPKHQSCDVEEHSQAWYEQEMERGREIREGNNDAYLSPPEKSDALSEEEELELERNDDILQHLLKIEAAGKNSTIVDKRVFHDVLVKTKDRDEIPPKKAPKSPSSTTSSKSKKRSAPASPKRSTPKRILVKRGDADESGNSKVAARSTDALAATDKQPNAQHNDAFPRGLVDTARGGKNGRKDKKVQNLVEDEESVATGESSTIVDNRVFHDVLVKAKDRDEMPSKKAPKSPSASTTASKGSACSKRSTPKHVFAKEGDETTDVPEKSKPAAGSTYARAATDGQANVQNNDAFPHGSAGTVRDGKNGRVDKKALKLAGDEESVATKKVSTIVDNQGFHEVPVKSKDRDEIPPKSPPVSTTSSKASACPKRSAPKRILVKRGGGTPTTGNHNSLNTDVPENSKLSTGSAETPAATDGQPNIRHKAESKSASKSVCAGRRQGLVDTVRDGKNSRVDKKVQNSIGDEDSVAGSSRSRRSGRQRSKPGRFMPGYSQDEKCAEKKNSSGPKEALHVSSLSRRKRVLTEITGSDAHAPNGLRRSKRQRQEPSQKNDHEVIELE